MSMYLGDFAEDATVYIHFTTNAADGGRESLSATIEEADIAILKDGVGMTLDASTITISFEVAGMTGAYVVAVDMSNDADFTTGSEYAAVLYPDDETVDGQNVVGVIGVWSCENRADFGTLAAINTKPSASAIREEIDDNSTVLQAITNVLGNFTGTGVNTILGFLKAIMSKTAATPSDIGGTFDPATDSVEAIRDRGDAEWTGGAGGGGSGGDTVTLTINDSGDNPIADCAVWITSDADGDTVVAGTLYTDQAGLVTFNLDAGTTYYCWRQKSGINFTNPSTFVAVAD